MDKMRDKSNYLIFLFINNIYYVENRLFLTILNILNSRIRQSEQFRILFRWFYRFTIKN